MINVKAIDPVLVAKTPDGDLFDERFEWSVETDGGVLRGVASSEPEALAAAQAVALAHDA